MIEITESQREAALRGEVVRLTDPTTGAELVLVLAKPFHEAVAEIEEDQGQQKAIRDLALKNAAHRMLEDE